MRAGGGLIPGGIGTRDTVRMRVKKGDFIVRTTAVRKIGKANLDQIATYGRMARLTPGEYRIPAAAAKSFGYDNLDRMNFDASMEHLAKGGMSHMGATDVLGDGVAENADKRGALARNPFGTRLQSPKQTQHQSTTNVWIVKPDEQPPMTKNDVIVAVAEDMLSNGVTKKLVKQVVQGG